MKLELFIQYLLKSKKLRIITTGERNKHPSLKVHRIEIATVSLKHKHKFMVNDKTKAIWKIFMVQYGLICHSIKIGKWGKRH